MLVFQPLSSWCEDQPESDHRGLNGEPITQHTAGAGGGVVKHPGFEELLFCLVSLEISGSPAE